MTDGDVTVHLGRCLFGFGDDLHALILPWVTPSLFQAPQIGSTRLE